MLREYFSCNEISEIFLTCFCNILCYVGNCRYDWAKHRQGYKIFHRTDTVHHLSLWGLLPLQRQHMGTNSFNQRATITSTTRVKGFLQKKLNGLLEGFVSWIRKLDGNCAKGWFAFQVSRAYTYFGSIKNRVLESVYWLWKIIRNYTVSCVSIIFINFFLIKKGWKQLKKNN